MFPPLLERLKSARYIMAITATALASILVIWIVSKASGDTIDKIAVISITGFFNIWSVIVTFYFTRSDRKPNG